MKQEFNINLSKILFDLFAVNMALGLANLIVFYTFWVDGWSYPSLFIFINLSTLIAFFLCQQFHLNPSFSLKLLGKYSGSYLLVFFLLVTTYWLIILDRKYYAVHLILFFTLTILFVFLFRLIWIAIFRRLLIRIYTTKNIMLIAKHSQGIVHTLLQNDWLRYSIECKMEVLKPDDIPLYVKQFDLDLILIDMKDNAHAAEDYAKVCQQLSVCVFFVNINAPKNQLEKIIGNYKLYRFF